MGRKKSTKKCELEACDRKHYGKGLCNKHYKKLYRFNDPLHGKDREKDYPAGRICQKCDSPNVMSRDLCKNCYDKWLKANNSEYYEKQKENTGNWHVAHRQEVAQYQQRRSIDPVLRARDKRTKYIGYLRRLGLTEQSVQSLLQYQENSCAICARSFTECTRHLDHDHETGLARGYLCSRCNNGLGMLGDNIAGLTKALKYLQNPTSAEYINET